MVLFVSCRPLERLPYRPVFDIVCDVQIKIDRFLLIFKCGLQRVPILFRTSLRNGNVRLATGKRRIKC